jgi:hypothetical protein
VLSVAAALYPVFVHLAVHAIWAATWLQEGRRPCASSGLSLGGLEWCILLPTSLMMWASPLAAATSIVLACIDPRHQDQAAPIRVWAARGLVALAAVTWGFSLVLAVADPLGAVEWFLD